LRNSSDITAAVYIFHDAGSLKAYADVTFRSRVGEITVRRFKVIANDSGKLWVALPQFEFQRLLSAKYVDSVVLSKRAMRRVQRVVLKKYAEKLYQSKAHGQVDHS